MSLALSKEAPFARGGNRLCFIHPEYPDRCIKVRRPDFTLEQLRKKKGFPKTLKPLSSFDDNLEEHRVLSEFRTHRGEAAFSVVSECFGFIETDLGKGLVSKLIRDAQGNVSHTLKQYLWDHGYTDECQQAVSQFAKHWVELALPSRDLLLHNIVVQLDEQGAIVGLFVIDGLGSPNFFPYWWLPKSAQRKKAQKRIDNLHTRIQDLLALRGSDTFPGYHGLLLHDGLDTQGKTS